MDAVREILGTIPLDQIAAELGTDPATAERLAGQLIPALIGGMSANAQDAGGAQSLAAALSEHSNSSLLDGGVSLEQVDTNDGEAIVQNVFGARTPDVTQALGRQVAGGNNEMVQKLLRILAPIVLAYLASRLTRPSGDSAGGGSGGGILGSILDSILGGGRGQQQAPAPTPQQQGGGGLSDILLDMLGGGGGAAPSQQPQQRPAPEPQFEQPRSTGGDGPAAPTIPIDEPSDQGPRQQQPGGYGGSGSILGDILGGLLGGGRRA